jgi:fluoroquinolone transport system ATP-binding protein
MEYQIIKTMIIVKNLNYTYPGNHSETLSGINFNIEKGEIFGFLGPNGAGKSTTQKVLTRLLRNYLGEVRILGKDLHTWHSEFYDHIGVGFELPNHYAKLTAMENLKFFAAFYNKPVKNFSALLARVGLEKDANKKIESYSKGMKVRLNFVRAIMHDPDILFLDEPTTGLDPSNARIIKDIILELKKQGKTIFLTTHNMHDAEELCDRVSFIANGSLRVTDSPRNLKLMNGQRRVRVDYGNQSTETKEFDLDSIGSNREFMELIRKEHIASIHSLEAGLDEIFIKTTGTRLA